MSSFLDDLLSADESLLTGDVINDPVVRELIESAARSANLSALEDAFARGQVPRESPQDLVLSIVGIAGNQQGSMAKSVLAQRIEFVERWVMGTLPADPGQKQDRLDALLDACFSGYFSIHDAVAAKLMLMGANPMAAGFAKSRPMSGARLGMEQVEESTLSRAMYSGSKVIGIMIAAVNARTRYDDVNGEPTQRKHLPDVAIIKRGNKTVSVNAAAYAIAIADLRQLDQVIHSVDISCAKVRQELGQAIGQVMKLGLHEFGSDEVHHGIVRLLACGALVQDVSSFAKTAVIVVESPSLKFFGDKGVIVDGERVLTSEEARKMQRITLPVALLNTPKANWVVKAIGALAAQGWDTNEVASLPMNGTQGGATVSHYAALRGNVDILNALKEAGADFALKDSFDRTPVDYAWAGLNRASAWCVDKAAAQVMEQARGGVSSPSETQKAAQQPLSDDDINAMLSEASADQMEDYASDVEPQEVTKPTRAPVAPRASASMFAALRQGQQKVRDRAEKTQEASGVSSSSAISVQQSVVVADDLVIAAAQEKNMSVKSLFKHRA